MNWATALAMICVVSISIALVLALINFALRWGRAGGGFGNLAPVVRGLVAVGLIVAIYFAVEYNATIWEALRGHRYSYFYPTFVWLLPLISLGVSFAINIEKRLHTRFLIGIAPVFFQVLAFLLLLEWAGWVTSIRIAIFAGGAVGWLVNYVAHARSGWYTVTAIILLWLSFEALLLIN